jgi:transposase InsO family protein
MRDHMRAELTIAALIMAIQRQKPPPGLIHHSDRGSQYAAAGYRKVLGAAGMIQSMSRKGNCWDNAPMESFFGTLKTELVHQACYPTRIPPGATCSPTSKDTTIVSGFIPPSGISPPNRQSAKPLNPVSTKSGEGQYGATQAGVYAPAAMA